MSDALDMFRDLDQETDGQEEEAVQAESNEEVESEVVGEEAPEASSEAAEAEEVVTPSETPEATQEAVEAGFMGGKYKTPEDLEKAYRELQSMKDREIAEVRAKVEAYESLINSPEPQQQPQQVQQVSQEDLAAAVEAAPVDAFQWAIYNRPDLVPDVISQTREKHDNATADKMQNAYMNAMMQAQQAQVQDMLYQAQAPQQTQQNLSSALHAVRESYGEDFDLLKDDVAEMLQEHGELESTDPQYVAGLLEHYLLKAYRKNALTKGSAEAPTPPPPAQVSPAAPAPDPAQVSGADAFVQEIVDMQNKYSY